MAGKQFNREPCPNCHESKRVQKRGINKGKQRWYCTFCDVKWTGLPVAKDDLTGQEQMVIDRQEKREEAAATAEVNDGTAELVEEIDRLLAFGREQVGEERDLLTGIAKEHDRIVAREAKRDQERSAELHAARYADHRTPAEKEADRAVRRKPGPVESLPADGPEVVDAPEDVDVDVDVEMEMAGEVP